MVIVLLGQNVITTTNRGSKLFTYLFDPACNYTCISSLASSIVLQYSNDHLHGTTIPPIWKAYKFVSNGHKVIGWLLAEKKGDSPDPVYYFGEGNSFTLIKGMHGHNSRWATLEKE